MEAVELRGKGLEKVVLTERPAPVPGPGEALVDVEAVGLNYRDLLIIRGDYPVGGPLPLILGSDVAGVVRQAPEGAPARPGERVVVSYVVDWLSGPPVPERTTRRLGGPLHGGLARQIVVPAHALVPVPAGLDAVHAAALPVAGVTAWRALFRAASLRPGDHVLLFGMGGVSTLALQLAARAGARPIVVGHSPGKLAAARELGAALTLDGREPWTDAVLEATGGRGVEVVLDVLGGDNLSRAAAVTRGGGVIVSAGFVTGTAATLDLPTLIRRSVRIEGVSVGSREDLEDLIRAIAAGALRPAIDRVFPLASFRDAFAHLERGGHIGKVIVEVAR